MPRSVISSIAFIIIASFAYAEDHRSCIEKVRIGPCRETPHRLGFDEINHGLLDDLLHAFVDCRGMVCYRAWLENCQAVADLDRYLCYLGAADTSKPASRQATLAFYINAYNALAIYGILRDYPTPSIQKLNKKGAAYRIFDDLEWSLDGRFVSLNHIEHKILRPMGEPRIHFALVCAARGCPKLRNEAYHGATLEQQLTNNAIDFFANRKRFRISRVSGKVWVSPILKWFGKDFGSNDQEVLARIYLYLPPDAQSKLACGSCVTLHYLGYDWSLNDQCPTLCIRTARPAYGLYSRVEPFVNRMKSEQDPNEY